MKRLILLCILLIFTLPVIAQDDDPAILLFEPVTISNLRINLNPETGISLLFDASPAICGDLLVSESQRGRFVDVTVVAPQDALCDTGTSSEHEINVTPQQVRITYVLTVNNYTSLFYLTEVESENSDEAFAIFWGEETSLIQFDPILSLIDSFTIEGQRQMVISGNHPDGCEVAEYIRLHPEASNDDVLHVEMVRLIPIGVICPANLVPFEEVVSLLNASSDIILEGNGTYIQLTDSFPIEVEPQAVDILSVDVNEADSGFTVTITSEQNANCEVEPRASIIERDYMTIIEIFAFTNDDSICMDDAVFTDSYEVEVLPVIVNGIAYDDNGVIEPIIRSQSIDLAEEGNFMTVDTVIESVEISVLESFPMQLELTIAGYHPDGCDLPVTVEQAVDGNAVTMSIYRDVPSDVMCPMVLNPYEESIRVDGTFEGGTVTIEINGFTTEIDL